MGGSLVGFDQWVEGSLMGTQFSLVGGEGGEYFLGGGGGGR